MIFFQIRQNGEIKQAEVFLFLLVYFFRKEMIFPLTPFLAWPHIYTIQVMNLGKNDFYREHAIRTV
jgi:hypothetical protein